MTGNQPTIEIRHDATDPERSTIYAVVLVDGDDELLLAECVSLEEAGEKLRAIRSAPILSVTKVNL